MKKYLCEAVMYNTEKRKPRCDRCMCGKPHKPHQYCHIEGRICGKCSPLSFEYIMKEIIKEEDEKEIYGKEEKRSKTDSKKTTKKTKDSGYQS